MEALDVLVADQLCCLLLLRGKSPCPPLRRRKSAQAENVVGPICLCRSDPSQVFCSICCRIRHFRDQVHYCWVCHEGLSWRLDTPHQINRITTGYCLWSLGRKGGPERAFCCVYRKCHITLFPQVQAKCLQDERNHDRIGRSWCSRCLWKPHRRGSVFPRGG